MNKTTKSTKTVISKAPAAKPAAAPRTATAAAAPGRAPTAPEPRTRPNSVSLVFVKPEAKQVFVAGSFNQWRPEKTPLSPAGNGRWVGDLAVTPGKYEYLFVVDGQWIPDPNAKEAVQNPFGGWNSVLTVSA
jgi:hypothetical protein